MKHILIFFFSIVIPGFLLGQPFFKEEYEKRNPIERGLQISSEERKAIHENYMKEAVSSQDMELLFFANLFLLSDYMRNRDYVKAKKYLIKADSIAVLLNNKRWQGHVFHRKGILDIKLEKLEDSKQANLSSIALCGEVGDSICVAEGIEQIGYIYGYQGDFIQSRVYFEEAVRLFDKFGSKQQLASAYNNYAIVCVRNGEVEAAMALYKQAITIFEELNMTQALSSTTNNLADAYRNQGKYDSALILLEKCMEINVDNGFVNSLYTNYRNISAVYDSLGDYKRSKAYFIKYHTLRDSLIGAATQDRIAFLNVQFETQKKELELANSALELYDLRVKNRRITFLILGLTLFAAILFAIGYKRMIKKNLDLNKVKNEAEDLAMKNEERKRKILELENDWLNFRAKIYGLKGEKEIYDFKNTTSTILTKDDWSKFKSYFHELHPGYVYKLRSIYKDLTPAEERLFLLLKLNYSKKEISNILGISEDSVKKTRLRLRKRLQLDKEVKLDDFIRTF